MSIDRAAASGREAGYVEWLFTFPELNREHFLDCHSDRSDMEVRNLWPCPFLCGHACLRELLDSSLRYATFRMTVAGVAPELFIKLEQVLRLPSVPGDEDSHAFRLRMLRIGEPVDEQGVEVGVVKVPAFDGGRVL